MKLRLACLALIGALGWSLPAAAQAWPSRPVRLIVPTGPGSATDLMARLMANEVSRAIGGAVFVENIAGASGIPAHQATARAAADGYNFLFTNTSGLASNPVTFRQLPYDPAKDFDAVAIIADLAPQMVSVNSKLPVKSVPELIAHAKANSGKIDYAVDATTGGGVVSGRLLNRRGAMNMAEVSYKSAPQMVQDVAAGQVPVLISSIAATQPFVDSGDVRPLGVFSGRRFPGLPDLPTVSETLPGVVLDGFFVIVAPAGTPADIVERFNKAVAQFLRSPEAPQRLNTMGLASSGAARPRARPSSFGLNKSAGASWRASSTFSRNNKCSAPSLPSPRTGQPHERRSSPCRQRPL